ncbi:MAG: RES family NAD+ phosphorylase, partial [Acidobacteria bacterium]|nr:RES family NAD+ phosphorylase [Acidobacteriota bacterium]
MASPLSEPANMIAAAGAWINYETSLRTTNPHMVHDSTYFDHLLHGCLACGYSMGPGWDLFRARVMPVDRHGDSEPLPIDEMGAPPPAKAGSGRMNPEGTACFYAALELETAIAESRPWT